MKYGFLLSVLAGIFSLTAGAVVSEYSHAEEMSCSEIKAEKQDLKEQYKSGKHNERKAFDNWDKYYKELHSIEYGGTESPLADTAKACRDGDGPNELFCKEALKRYDELSEKEGNAKKELDASKVDADEMGDKMRALGQKARDSGCK